MEKYKSIIASAIVSGSAIIIACIFTFLSPQPIEKEESSVNRYSLFQGKYTVRYSAGVNFSKPDQLILREGIFLLDSQTGKTTLFSYRVTHGSDAYYGWLPLKEVKQYESLYMIDGSKNEYLD